MSKIRKYWLLVGYVVILGAVIGTHELGPNTTQAAGSAPVMVTNTPLPVQGTVNAAQSGTWNVGLTGTPAVSAAQSGTWNVSAGQTGTWNVGITGTPTVNLAPGASVRDADNPARQPAQFLGGCNMDPGVPSCGATVYTVPSGQRLVVEYVFLGATLPTTEKLTGFSITTVANAVGIVHGVAPSYQADDGSFAYFLASQATRLYADPTTDMNMGCSRSVNTSGGLATCSVTFSGYLVNLP